MKLDDRSFAVPSRRGDRGNFTTIPGGDWTRNRGRFAGSNKRFAEGSTLFAPSDEHREILPDAEDSGRMEYATDGPSRRLDRGKSRLSFPTNVRASAMFAGAASDPSALLAKIKIGA